MALAVARVKGSSGAMGQEQTRLLVAMLVMAPLADEAERYCLAAAWVRQVHALVATRVVDRVL